MFPNEEEWRCSLCVSPGQGDARLLVQLLISSRANEGRQADQRPGGVYAGCALCLNMNLRPGWCAWADDKRDRSTQDPRICIRHVPRVCKSCRIQRGVAAKCTCLLGAWKPPPLSQWRRKVDSKDGRLLVFSLSSESAVRHATCGLQHRGSS